MRLRDQLLEDRGIENLAADGHPLPHVVEQRAIDISANCVAGLLQQRVRAGEQLVVRRELLEAEILHPHDAELLEVRVRVPPAAPLIEPDAVGEHLPKRALGFLQVEPAQRGFEQPFGSELRVRPVEAEGPLRPRAQLLATEPARTCILQRAEKARADQAHEEEVVEMARLERGVLTVVGEAEELPRVVAQARLGTVHPAQRAGHQYRRRRAAALGGERGETCAIAGRTAMSFPAAETESELAAQEPRRRPGTDSPVGRHREASSTRVAIVRLQPQVAAGVELDPRLRDLARSSKVTRIVDRMRCQEAEDLLLGPRLLSNLLGLFLPGRRRVVDVPREEDECPVVPPRQPHRVILVPALATEVHGV